MILDIDENNSKFISVNPNGDGFVFDSAKAAKEKGISEPDAIAQFKNTVDKINDEYRKEYGTDLFFIG